MGAHQRVQRRPRLADVGDVLKTLARLAAAVVGDRVVERAASIACFRSAGRVSYAAYI